MATYPMICTVLYSCRPCKPRADHFIKLVENRKNNSICINNLPIKHLICLVIFTICEESKLELLKMY